MRYSVEYNKWHNDELRSFSYWIHPHLRCYCNDLFGGRVPQSLGFIRRVLLC